MLLIFKKTSNDLVEDIRLFFFFYFFDHATSSSRFLCGSRIL